ncbi:MAG: cytochrome b/b6 domain-containing protein [bacterium]
MFRVISVIGFVSIILAFIYVRISKPKTAKGLALLLAQMREIRLRNFLREYKKAVYALGIASFILLTLSGFLPIVLTGNSVTGVLLLIHALVAPVFAVCIAVVSVLWAHHHRFDKNDWQSFRRLIQRKTANEKSNPQLSELAKKVSFWLILLLSLLVIGSIILSMYQLFGVSGQEMLLHLHGYSALFLVMAVVMNLYLARLAQKVDPDN